MPMGEVQTCETNETKRKKWRRVKIAYGVVLLLTGAAVFFLSLLGDNENNDVDASDDREGDEYMEEETFKKIPVSVIDQLAQEHYRGVGAKMEGKDLIGFTDQPVGKLLIALDLDRTTKRMGTTLTQDV